jgi:hypothetical protein
MKCRSPEWIYQDTVFSCSSNASRGPDQHSAPILASRTHTSCFDTNLHRPFTNLGWDVNRTRHCTHQLSAIRLTALRLIVNVLVDLPARTDLRASTTIVNEMVWKWLTTHYFSRSNRNTHCICCSMQVFPPAHHCEEGHKKKDNLLLKQINTASLNKWSSAAFQKEEHTNTSFWRLHSYTLFAFIQKRKLWIGSLLPS